MGHVWPADWQSVAYELTTFSRANRYWDAYKPGFYTPTCPSVRFTESVFPVLFVSSSPPQLPPFDLLCNLPLLFPEWRRGWRRGWRRRWGQWIRRQQQFLILFRRLFWFGLQLNYLLSSTLLAVLYSVLFFRIIVTLQLESWDGEETEGGITGLIHFFSSQSSHCINNVWLWERGARGRVHNSW